jgi:hypothetical protein
MVVCKICQGNKGACRCECEFQVGDMVRYINKCHGHGIYRIYRVEISSYDSESFFTIRGKPMIYLEWCTPKENGYANTNTEHQEQNCCGHGAQLFEKVDE